MKNRFYGDKKDYFKYGLLDILSYNYKSIGINWYLTDDHHGNQGHGRGTGYLDNENWRYYNQDIFYKLKNRVEQGERNVKYCMIDNVINNFKYEAIEQLPDNANQSDYELLRKDWHSKAMVSLAKCDLIFFDPDIGVKNNLPHGAIRGSEHAKINEINDYDWCDWLVIQFLQPINRFNQLFANPITISAKTRNKKIVAFIAENIALLYLTERIDLILLRRLFEYWDTKISPQILIS
ncbi:MAG: hypothetical protein ACLPT6_02155 [Desulfobaccales bacterium]